jgi:hypothetical protein
MVYLVALNLFEITHAIALGESLFNTGFHFTKALIFSFRSIILPILCIFIEPRLLFQLKNKFVKKDSEILIDPNVNFLGSSFNNLLVCGILKGINITLENQELEEGDSQQ